MNKNTIRSIWQFMGMVGSLLWVGCAGNSQPNTPFPLPTQAEVAVILPTATASPVPTSPLAPTYTALPSYSYTVAPSPTPTPTNTPTPTITPTPTATRDRYAGFRLEELVARHYGGGELVIEETLESNDVFTRYLVRYPSDGLNIYGFMNVPHEGDTFPVALVLHGFINPEDYKVMDYTTRYADWLAEAGYMVFHPNYRNHPPSDTGEDFFRIGYAIDVLNLLAVIREQSQDPTSVLRRADAGNIHIMGHSMGGGIAWRVMTVRPEWLRAVAFYGSMNADEAKNYEKIAEWTEGRAGILERRTPQNELEAISPVYHLERSVNVPVSIHHGNNDGTVPISWSVEACERLQGLGYTVECFPYGGQPHTFYGGGEDLFMERLIAFFRRY